MSVSCTVSEIQQRILVENRRF